MHHFSIITTSSSSSSSAEADGGSIATATGTGASPPLIVSTYSVSGSCFVAGNAWCIANSFVPQHDCFCLRHRPFVCPFVECSDRLHLVQCCFIIHNFLIRFLTLLLLCSSFLLVLSSSASVPSLKRPATTWTIYFARSPIAPTGKPSYQDWCPPHACGAGASFMVSMEHFFRLYLFPPFSPESCVCWVSCCSGLSARLLFLSLLCLSALHVSGVEVDDAVVVALVPKVSVLLVSIRSAGEQSNSSIEFTPPTTRSLLSLFNFFKGYFTMSFVSHVIVSTLSATHNLDSNSATW